MSNAHDIFKGHDEFMRGMHKSNPQHTPEWHKAVQENIALKASNSELREALELCLHAVELAGWEGDFCAEKARAAIAKAKGTL